MYYFIEASTKQSHYENFIAMNETEKETVLAKFEQRRYLKVKFSEIDF